MIRRKAVKEDNYLCCDNTYHTVLLIFDKKRVISELYAMHSIFQMSNFRISTKIEILKENNYIC